MKLSRAKGLSFEVLSIGVRMSLPSITDYEKLGSSARYKLSPQRILSKTNCEVVKPEITHDNFPMLIMLCVYIFQFSKGFW